MKTPHVLALLAAALPFHASAGTLFYVPIPAKDSEVQSGLNSEKAYTSAIAAGNTKPVGRSVNGLAFAAMRGDGKSVTANGVTLNVRMTMATHT